MQTKATPADLDDILVALADPTRRAILAQLSTGPTRVTDIAAPFDISLNSVSKHIRILERANLVARFRSGREHILTFNPTPLSVARQWMETHQTLWGAQLKAAGDALLPKDKKLKVKAKPKPRRARKKSTK